MVYVARLTTSAASLLIVKPMRSPVLFVIFNRPDLTRRSFEAIRRAAPPRLYVAADGPRDGRAQEAERTREVRAIATAVDWPCEVFTLFRDRNLGCKLGVAGAIDWFFEHEEEGIILEDDCVPSPSFFEWCDAMLERYRDDERIASVSGSSFIGPDAPLAESYFVSRYADIWGWATWRRSWRHYDIAMSRWPEWRASGGLEQLSDGNPVFVRTWRALFDDVAEGRIDTWDYQWQFACWQRGALGLMPSVNQIENLGFGGNATHTHHAAPAYLDFAHDLPMPLRHPVPAKRRADLDAIIDQRRYYLNRRHEAKTRLRALPIIGPALGALALARKRLAG